MVLAGLGGWPPVTAGAQEARDTVVLIDGRVLSGTVEGEAGELWLRLGRGGRVSLPAARIQELLLAPAYRTEAGDDRSRELLSRGYVCLEDTWMPRERGDLLLERRRREVERAAAEALSHLDFENAWSETTPHFTVRTNTSPELLRRYSRLLEYFYETFDRRWDLTLTGSDRKFRPEVRIYRDRSQYLASGAPPQTGGVFDQVTRVLSLFHDASDPEGTLDVLYHEATHLLLNLLRPRFLFPVWVDEGIAEYYSTAREEGGALAIGAVHEGRLVVLRKTLSEGRMIPLKELLLTERERFGGVHYAEAWSFVHFLMSHERHAPRFLSFFKQLATGRGLHERSLDVGHGVSRRMVGLDDTLALLQKHLGVRDLAGLESEWLEFVASELPAPGPRGWLIAAQLHYRDRDLPSTRAALEEARARGCGDAAWHALQARVRNLEGSFDEAEASYRAALALDPLNPELHQEFGRALLQRPGSDADRRAEGVQHLGTAADLDLLQAAYAAEYDRVRHELERIQN